MNIRNLAEKFSRGIVVSRRLPTQFGKRKIYVSPEAGLRYWKLSLENIDPMLFYIAENFVSKGDIIWDVGANLGIFSFPAIIRSETGKCLAFEPDVWLCNILNKSIKENDDLDIHVLPIAVSEEVGFVNFNIANRSRATNFIGVSEGSTQTGGIRTSIMIPTVNLDHVLKHNEAPDFVKIDTEGAEAFVLKGAMEVLKKRPKILCEVSSLTFPYIYKILKELNYEIYDASKLPDMVIADSLITDNILALPK